nr:hypothetical protein [Leifsonia sp. Leaf325]
MSDTRAHEGDDTSQAAESAEEAPESEVPSDEVLDEPSTENDPGEETRAAKPDDSDPDHEAVGIGVIDGPPATGG